MKKVTFYLLLALMITCFSCQIQADHDLAMENFMATLDNEALLYTSYEGDEEYFESNDPEEYIEEDSISMNHEIEFKIKVTTELVKN